MYIILIAFLFTPLAACCLIMPLIYLLDDIYKTLRNTNGSNMLDKYIDLGKGM